MDERSKLQKLIEDSDAALARIVANATGADDDGAAREFAAVAARVAFLRACLAHVQTQADAARQGRADQITARVVALDREISLATADARALSEQLKALKWHPDVEPERERIAQQRDATNARIAALMAERERLSAGMTG
jgi:septal ring factor EnvC (AmiA/AmiB activator)